MTATIVRVMLAVFLVGMGVLWYRIPDSFFVVRDVGGNEMVIIKSEPIEVKEESIEVREEPEKEKDVIEDKSEGTVTFAGEIEERVLRERVEQSVAFVVQAPRAQWDDPRYQDACEEASMVMAHAWITGDDSISKDDAEKQIEEIFRSEKDMFGDVVDTSAADTARFFATYYGHDVSMKVGAVLDDLYRILSEDKIIIVPTNGKALQNPNFTDGGPDRHMLVIVGYDKKNREFITNDPGTRMGRGYKYKDTTLYNAIRDYETGNKLPIVGTKKNLIIVSK